MVRSGFQFANPILERVSFVTNNKFDSDKFEGIDIESQTSVEMHEENTAKVSLNVIVGSSEDNQPFNIDIVMSAKEKIGDTILLDFYAKRVNKTKKVITYFNDLFDEENLEEYVDVLISYLEQFRPRFRENLLNNKKIELYANN